jgi:hypothetical protein
MTKFKRFFAFGCSYTEYLWPTWADIIGKQYGEKYINCGKYGAGNSYIHSALMEADQTFRFDKEDLIIICWTSCFRQDQYMHGNWELRGNIINWGEKYVKRFFDPRGFLIRDLALIKSVCETLENKGCRYEMISAFPFSSNSLFNDALIRETEIDSDIVTMYSDILLKIHPSYYEVLEKKERPIKGRFIDIVDSHPTPAEHLEYIKRTIPEYLPDDCTFVNQYMETLYYNYMEERWWDRWDVFNQRTKLIRL